jgi:hypothetical protein
MPGYGAAAANLYWCGSFTRFRASCFDWAKPLESEFCKKSRLPIHLIYQSQTLQ